MQRVPSLYVAHSPKHGRGVFTSEDIPEGTILEICPIILIPEGQVDTIHSTVLHDYYFLWGDHEEEAAIALGFGSMYNHSFEPNASYFQDFDNNTMDFIAIKDIRAGDEILVNYNGIPDCKDPVWFNTDLNKR